VWPGRAAEAGTLPRRGEWLLRHPVVAARAAVAGCEPLGLDSGSCQRAYQPLALRHLSALALPEPVPSDGRPRRCTRGVAASCDREFHSRFTECLARRSWRLRSSRTSPAMDDTDRNRRPGTDRCADSRSFDRRVRRTQAPHVIAAVVVDDEKPAPWSEQACRVGDERRAWRGQVRPEDDDRIRAASGNPERRRSNSTSTSSEAGISTAVTRAPNSSSCRASPAAAVEDHDLLPDHRPSSWSAAGILPSRSTMPRTLRRAPRMASSSTGPDLAS